MRRIGWGGIFGFTIVCGFIRLWTMRLRSRSIREASWMLTRLVKRYKIDSGKKSRKGTASEFLGSLLLGDVLSGLPKSNSFACKGSNINRTKSCPMNGGSSESEAI